jgi:Spy/CpxP family protein refolding chaperone
MSETGPVQPPASVVPPPPRRRRRWLSVLLLVAVFLGGAICGAGVTAFAAVRVVRHAILHPEGHPEHGAHWLKRRLDLTDSQFEQVRKVLTEQGVEFARIRDEVRPRILERVEKTDGEIAKILTPEQQTKWRSLIHRFRERWLPNLPEPAAPKPPEP